MTFRWIAFFGRIAIFFYLLLILQKNQNSQRELHWERRREKISEKMIITTGDISDSEFYNHTKKESFARIRPLKQKQN